MVVGQVKKLQHVGNDLLYVYCHWFRCFPVIDNGWSNLESELTVTTVKGSINSVLVNQRYTNQS